MAHPYAGSTIIQATTEVSVPSDARMVKLVAAVRADTASADGTVTVPRLWVVRKMRLVAVTAVVATTFVPVTNVATPILALVPSATEIPLPVVLRMSWPPTVKLLVLAALAVEISATHVVPFEYTTPWSVVYAMVNKPFL